MLLIKFNLFPSDTFLGRIILQANRLMELSQHLRQTKSLSQSVRQRITPTFLHHNIFNQYDTPDSKHIRYTPTFSSTVFDCSGYQIQTKHSHPSKKDAQTTQKVVKCSSYKNISKQRKRIEMNPCCNYRVEKDNHRPIDQKNRVMQQVCQMGNNTSRMRKVVELMSNPIFGDGYFWDPKEGSPSREIQIEAYDPRRYRRDKNTDQNYKNNDQQNKKQQDKVEVDIKLCEHEHGQVHQTKEDKPLKQKVSQKVRKSNIQKTVKRFKSAKQINKK